MTDPVRLRYVTDAQPGLRRVRRGTGFQFVDTDGQTITDGETLVWINSLAIPPAWTDVWIAPITNAHLLATGRDARGRKQYRYHQEWRATRDRNKFDRLLDFGQALPSIRSQTDSDLRKHGMPKARVLAIAITLLDLTFIRVGNQECARENQSFGLTTLRNRHLKVDGSHVKLQFAGKGGKVQVVDISHPRLARIIQQMKELPGQTLFQFLDDDGQLRSLDSADVNDYLRSITGQDFSAKDFEPGREPWQQ